MKSKTNIFLLISGLIAIALTGWLYYLTTKSIGEYSENKRLDDNFQVCDEDKIFNYYGMETDYEGGKKAIKNKIWEEVKNLSFEKSGLITFRFIVNCQGEIGRFRYKSTDLELGEAKITSEKIEHLKLALLQLHNWNPAKREDKVYDSYYVLNFKVRNGKIIDIF